VTIEVEGDEAEQNRAVTPRPAASHPPAFPDERLERRTLDPEQAMNLLSCALILTAAGLAPASASSFADAVIASVQGPGATHPNFTDPLAALGAPNYADPGGTGFGTGAYSLGVAGSLTLRISTHFCGDGTPAADLLIHEIGPSSGGSAEATSVAVSADGVTWSAVGTAPGGTGGLDLDASGFGPAALLRFVRLTDASANPGMPAGADIDAVSALHAVATWTDLGSGLAGLNGVPQLAGSGTLAAGSACSLTLTSARPSSPALLFIALSSSPVPFKGGVLLATPALTTIALGTNAGGALALPFTWPAGVPAGVALYFQYAVQDAAALHGVSLSNALRGLTP
jgi:hypothetical protein